MGLIRSQGRPPIGEKGGDSKNQKFVFDIFTHGLKIANKRLKIVENLFHAPDKKAEKIYLCQVYELCFKHKYSLLQ